MVIPTESKTFKTRQRCLRMVIPTESKTFKTRKRCLRMVIPTESKTFKTRKRCLMMVIPAEASIEEVIMIESCLVRGRASLHSDAWRGEWPAYGEVMLGGGRASLRSVNAERREGQPTE